MLENDEPQRVRNADNLAFARNLLNKQRVSLLDLTRCNPLINAKTPTNRQLIRVVDEVPSELIQKLSNGDSTIIDALPELDVIPEDEKSSAFKKALMIF